MITDNTIDRNKILNLLQKWYFIIYGNDEDSDGTGAIKMCMRDLEQVFHITAKEKEEWGIGLKFKTQ